MFEIDHLDFFGNKEFDKIVDRLFSGLRVERNAEDGNHRIRVYAPRKGDSEMAMDKPSGSGEPSWRREVRGSTPVDRGVSFPNDDAAPPKSKRIWEGSGDPRDDAPPPRPIDAPEAKKEPKSVLEMLEDGDERLERLLGKIVDKKLAERKMERDDSASDDSSYEIAREYVAKNAGNEYDDDYEDDSSDEPYKKDIKVFIANRLTFLIQTLFPVVFDTSSILTTKDTMTIALDERKTYPAICSLDDLGYLTCQINNSAVVAREVDDFLVDSGQYANIYCFPTTIANRAGHVVWGIKFVAYPPRSDD